MNLKTIQRRVSTLTLAPNETQRVNFRASYISILSNSATADVLVCADSGLTSPMEANTGTPVVEIGPDGKEQSAIFSYVEFTNPSNVETMVVKYLLQLGRPDDSRTMIRGYLQMDLSAPVMQTFPSLAVTTEDYSILPADAAVKERIVQNTGDNPIWWGDENTDPATGRGLVLNPGGSAVINCSGVVCFISEGGESRLSIVNILKVA
jgi:hypothetical protein